MVALHCADGSKVVNVETSFVAHGALGRGNDSVLGLDLDDLDAEFRIYLLRCAAGGNSSFFSWYVGICYKAFIGRRIQEHFNGTGASYTAARRPNRVELVLPARSRAHEALLFWAKAADLPANALRDGRLGGGRKRLRSQVSFVSCSCKRANGCWMASASHVGVATGTKPRMRVALKKSGPTPLL